MDFRFACLDFPNRLIVARIVLVLFARLDPEVGLVRIDFVRLDPEVVPVQADFVHPDPEADRPHRIVIVVAVDLALDFVAFPDRAVLSFSRVFHTFPRPNG